MLTHRTASPQAWRRLRKTMTDSELRAIAEDIVNVIDDDDEMRDETQGFFDTIYHALAAKNWESLKQG